MSADNTTDPTVAAIVNAFFPAPGKGGVLSDHSIARLLEAGTLQIEEGEGLVPGLGRFQPASVDLCLSDSILSYPGLAQTYLAATDDGEQYLEMAPGECYLAATTARLKLPADICAVVDGKSSIGRRFISIHSAGFVDPGFEGQITLEIKNNSPQIETLRVGQAICQIRFLQLDWPAARPYGSPELGSHYQGQTGATPARG